MWSDGPVCRLLVRVVHSDVDPNSDDLTGGMESLVYMDNVNSLHSPSVAMIQFCK